VEHLLVSSWEQISEDLIDRAGRAQKRPASVVAAGGTMYGLGDKPPQNIA